ncbi:hypothetical protein RINTHM_10540 [Richelia intracellularis HM01]|nr:hypothetical protein RINTHM_10540 [Richelia intracellularis HM01]
MNNSPLIGVSSEETIFLYTWLFAKELWGREIILLVIGLPKIKKEVS